MNFSCNHGEKIILNKGFTDFIKFLSAIMIAVGHYSSYALDYSESLIYRVVPMFSGYIGVALFFFISGYGLMMSERKKHLKFGEFVKRRLMKVYLPVVLVSFMWQLILLYKTGEVLDKSWILQCLFATFWGFSDGILWFVKAIMICYILFRVYLKCRGKYGLLSLFLGTGVVYIVIYYYFAAWAAISIPIFSLGIVIADYNEEAYKFMNSYKSTLFLILVTIIMLVLYLWQGNLYLHSLCNWFVVCCLLFLCSKYNVDFDVPQWMNGLSYDIYITHNKVINYLRPEYTYIGFIRFTLVSLLAAIILYLIRKLLKI